MKLSEWCKKQGICYKTGWNWFKEGKLPVDAVQTASGTILINEKSGALEEIKKEKHANIYCRVSSHDKKADLTRQVKRCEEFAKLNGYTIDKVYKEVASGMNDKRSQLMKMFNTNTQYLIVEHKDRLTRFGFNYIEVFYKQLGKEIIVINKEDNDTSDLIKDLISIITSFCCRIYGVRRGKNKAERLKNELVDSDK